MDPSLVVVAVTRAGTLGDPVTVEVRYDMPVRVPFIDWLFGSSIELVGSATDRQEFA